MRSHKLICDNDLKYFSYKINNATNLGKSHFLSQIHKGLSFVTGRTDMFNCGTLMENTDKTLVNSADVAGLYPSIYISWGWLRDALKKTHERNSPKIRTENIARMADFIMKLLDTRRKEIVLGFS